MIQTTLLQRFALTGIAALALSSTVSAQAITYAPVGNDVEMLISNIFGVQCEGVTGIQINGAPIAVGRFDHGQGVGLNSGMMLTTGIPNYSLNPVGNFASTSLGSPPDMDIINYGNLNGSGAASYDAVSVEFDFTPSISDTIRFSYIFASEEYPEYANSSFNDRFMFLVSENGNTPINIATVPGTNTAVEINSINHIINPQYYINNTMVASAAYFVFDGYTVPLEAKFYAQVGSTYHIKLVISDIADAVYDSAIFLDEQESYNDISGQLTVNGQPAEGLLEIFNFVDDTLLAAPVESIVVSNGSYLADSLSSGMYHARFTPDPVAFPGAVPLYFQTASTWSGADLIGLPCYLNSADIDADTVNGSDGNASIFGNIIIDTTYLKSTVAFEGALVLLKDQSTHETVAYAFSGVDGNYTLTGVPNGDFYILVDVPYIPQTDTFFVSIQNGVSGEGFDYAILTEGIEMNGEPSLGIQNAELNVLELFPNPADETVFVTVSGKELLDAKLTTTNGKVVRTLQLAAGQQAVSTADLVPGVYLLSVANGKPVRIVVQH